MRVVSLVPSLSHALCDLGCRDMLVGVTNFCVRPADLHRSSSLIGGTKDPNLQKIADLKPNIILVNTEENKPEDIDFCREISTVIETYPKSPIDVPAMLRTLGKGLNAVDQAESYAAKIEESIGDLAKSDLKKSKKFLYYIWQEPYMIAGIDTYISRSLELLGWVNAYDGSDRYPVVSANEVARLSPDIVLLSSEPYPFRVRDAKKFVEATGWEAERILKIDGQLLSWYGTLTLEMLKKMSANEIGAPMIKR